MTDENPGPEIPDDGRILAALGINPGQVAAGSFQITYDGQPGGPVVKWTSVVRVPTATLARAFTIASAPMAAQSADPDVSRETSLDAAAVTDEAPIPPAPDPAVVAKAQAAAQKRSLAAVPEPDPEPEKPDTEMLVDETGNDDNEEN